MKDSYPYAGWIYAAQEEGTPLVKIGYTFYNDPCERLGTLRTSFKVPLSFVGLVYIAAGIEPMEQAIHARLASSRIEGEWFYLSINQAFLESVVRELLPFVAKALHLPIACRGVTPHDLLHVNTRWPAGRSGMARKLSAALCTFYKAKD